MLTFITVLQVLACLVIIASVLLQPSKGDAAALGAGSSQSILGSSGGTHILFKITMWTAVFLMASCLFVTRYTASQKQKSLIDGLPAVPAPVAPETAPPAAPAAPAAPSTPNP